jgi:hypothetical protein
MHFLSYKYAWKLVEKPYVCWMASLKKDDLLKKTEAFHAVGWDAIQTIQLGCNSPVTLSWSHVHYKAYRR